jgi:hypothetical protein
VCVPFQAFSTYAAIFKNATPAYTEKHLRKNIYGDNERGNKNEGYVYEKPDPSWNFTGPFY